MRVNKQAEKKRTWLLRLLFWRQKKVYGQALVSSMVWARVPKLFFAISRLYGVLNRKSSPLSLQLRLLVTVRVSQINGCDYCVDLNTARLLRTEGAGEKVMALSQWKESACFSTVECAVLEYAEKMTYTDQEVDDICFGQLSLFFDDQSLVELTALIAFQNLSSKFNSALKIPAQGFCQLK